jgi:bifunctional non-homologous end joining protein LigD
VSTGETQERAGADPLSTYRSKRDAERTPEPAGGDAAGAGSGVRPRFVVQQHAARRMHWDLRLEVDGVLWSWAVPNGPSRDPAEKRLAVHTEDHPLEYLHFEDVIPEGNYGAGAMIVWDQGTYVPLHPMVEGLAKGKLLFDLRGHKLRGAWTLVKMQKAEDDAWLLIKERDAMARAGPDEFADDSVLSGLTVAELGSGDDPAEPIRADLHRLNAPRRVLDPGDTRLMLAESADAPFSRADWVFEFKYDGYRTLAFREDDEVRLLTRRGNDLAAAFPELVQALLRLPYRRFLLDGEIVVHDDAGLPSFQRLQRRAGLRRPADLRRAEGTLPATLWLFDALGFEDRDLRTLPLLERKAVLRRLLPGAGTLRYSDHVAEQGEALYEQAARLGLEGVIGKKADGRYRPGRSAEWLKLRVHRSDDFVIVGWTTPKGSRSGFGALHLAQYQDGTLRWTGQVGTGFTDRQLRDLHGQLEAGQRQTPPCAGAPTGKGHAWTRPELVCEVRFLERTEGGVLRQPVFIRLRDDKTPADCVWPAARQAIDEVEPEDPADTGPADTGPADTGPGDVGPGDTGPGDTGLGDTGPGDTGPGDTGPEGTGRGDTGPAGTGRGGTGPADTATAERSAGAVRFTNLEKLYWPEDGLTKGDLIAYYRVIAPWMLPYLKDRPVVLTRFPDGIHGKSFFQKDAPSFAPEWLRTVTIRGEGGERDLSYFVCDNVDTLLYLANSGSIPLHLWSSRVASIDQPDWCILDLDPKDAPFGDVVEVARVAKGLCDDIGLPLHVKTSGSSGLHLLVPLGGQLDHAQAKVLGELLARVLVRRVAAIATIARAVSRRGGKVYIDYLQNGRGKLLAAPYCVRPLPGAPVSAPLRWSEVRPGLDIRRFTIRSMPRRVRSLKADPLLPALTEAPDLLSALEALQGAG